MSGKLFTADERKEYEALVHQRGFHSLRDSMKALIARDVEQPYKGDDLEDDDDLGDPVESFRRAWGEAMRGEGMSREEFRRRMLNNDD